MNRNNLIKDKVDVIIPVCNSERYIERCLDSVLAQTYRQITVTVVDDGSTDDTAKIVKSHKVCVDYIRLDHNHGPAYARNIGLRCCSGDFVAFLDSDDYWEPEFVAVTVSFLNKNVEAIAVSVGEIRKRFGGGECKLPVLSDEDLQRIPEVGVLLDDFFAFWTKYWCVHPGTVMMRTECVLQTGGLRENMIDNEDLEFWAYLATFGPWGFIPRHLCTRDVAIMLPKERLAKYEKRSLALCAMTVEEWEQRIRPRLNNKDLPGFQMLISQIVNNITLACAFSGRYQRAWRLAKKWRDMLRPGKGTVLKVGLMFGPIFWPLFCKTTYCLEWIRTYWPQGIRLLERLNRRYHRAFYVRMLKNVQVANKEKGNSSSKYPWRRHLSNLLF